MKLSTGKTRGFVITGSGRELAHASRMPGAVYRISEGIVRMTASVSSWKALRDVQFDELTDSAIELLEALRTQHTEHRRRVRNATRRFKLTGETDIPVPLLSIPMEHQTRGFGFCSMLDESALFADMGTGKTLIAIAIAVHRAQQASKAFRVLVICPKAVKPVWPREIEKHTTHPFSIGIDCPPITWPNHDEVWVTNYDRVKREVNRLKKWKPDMVILDESHRIKNRKASRTKAVSSIKSPYRLILTGSPMGKCISEVWSQINFLNPAVFGSFSQFKERYLKMGGYMGYKVVGYKNEDEFAEKLHSLAFRVTKEECMDLPPLSYQRLYVEADRRTKGFYDRMDLKMFFEEDCQEVSVDREATKQMKLRQIVGGMVKSDTQDIVHISNLKAEALREILEDRVDDKTVVFCSFTHEIEIVKDLCKKIGVRFRTMQGSTPAKERDSFEVDFQNDPSIGVAIIQTDTGAEGMTLTAADVAIFYSPTFSYIKAIQARDRINRKGQERPMTIIWLIMAGTVDERVVDVLESNRQLTDTFMELKRNYTMAAKKAATPEKETAKAKTTEGYTASHMAESLGIEPAELRKHLRATGAEKPGASWNWPSEKAAAGVRKQIEAHMKEQAAKPPKEKAAKAPAKKEDAPKPSKPKAKKASAKE